MHFLTKFTIVMCMFAGILSIFMFIHAQEQGDETKPQSTLTYDDVMPKGFSALNIQRVLDPNDAGRIMHPTPQTAQVAKAIVTVCQTPNKECELRAINNWVRLHIEHTQVIQVRDHLLTPEETLLFRQGDDMAMSILMATLLRAQNIPARIGRTPYSSFVEATVDNTAVRIDLGCVNCGIGSTRYRGEDERINWIE